MKALTLIQPWATFIAIGAKPDETRGTKFSHRGEVAIHAGLKNDEDGAPQPFTDLVLGADWPTTCPHGAVVAIGTLVDCIPTEVARKGSTQANLLCGNFAPGRQALRFENVRPLWTPIPARGMQGLWDWTPPADIAFRLKEPVSHAEFCRRFGWGDVGPSQPAADGPPFNDRSAA